MNPADDSLRQLHAALDHLGTDVTMFRVGNPTIPSAARALVQMVNPRDEAVVQAFGVQAMYLDFSAPRLGFVPAKFDSVAYSTRSLTIEVVHDILINGVVIGFHCIARGR
jgi:hypothetical protein